MGMTIAEKIIARAAGVEEVKPGQIHTVELDYLMSNDGTTHLTIDMYNNKLKNPRIADKDKIVFIVDHNIPADLGLVIGAITESQKLIDHALESEQKGGQINMCNALEELRQGEVLSNFTLSNVSFVFSFKPFRLKWNFT